MRAFAPLSTFPFANAKLGLPLICTDAFEISGWRQGDPSFQYRGIKLNMVTAVKEHSWSSGNRAVRLIGGVLILQFRLRRGSFSGTLNVCWTDDKITFNCVHLGSE